MRHIDQIHTTSAFRAWRFRLGLSREQAADAPSSSVHTIEVFALMKTVEDGIKAVFLGNHGPNIVHGKDIPAQRVIDFIERHCDLEAKAGGLVA